MPYRIVTEPRGVYKKYTGHVTGQQFLEAVQQVNASSDFETFRYVINDFTECDAFDLSAGMADEAVAAAIGAQASNPTFVAAFVARDEGILKSLASMAQIAQAYLRVAVFESLTEARQWAASSRLPSHR